MSIQLKYNELDSKKSALMTKAEKYAGWTLPYIFLPVATNVNTEVTHDLQSLGARVVNHLSNKLTLTLFNPSKPFFRLDTEPEFLKKIVEAGLAEAAVQVALAAAERAAFKKLGKRGTRSAITLAMKNLIITGNCLKYVPTDGGNIQVYSLRDYVIQRDLSGRVITIITRDTKAFETLPVAVQAEVRKTKPTIKPTEDVPLYTLIELVQEKYYVSQAAGDVDLPGTMAIPLEDGTKRNAMGVYTKEALPWIPLTWTLPRGWSYGVGLVEDYAGDFAALSALSEAIVTGAAIAADIKFLVDPAGATDVKLLNDSASGSYIPGRKEDIQTLTTDKQNDWDMVLSVIQAYEKRIGLAFLLGSAVTRDAERVTAEEIRYQAQELETSLGGVYSRLSDELQLPLANLVMQDINIGDTQKITPTIITGLEALGRNSELESIMLFFQDLGTISQLDEVVKARIDIVNLMAVIGASRGVDYAKFIKKEEQVQQEQQQQQQAMTDQQAQIEQNKAATQMAAQGAMQDG